MIKSVHNIQAISLIGGICSIAVGIYILYGPSISKKKRKKGVKCPGLVNLGNSCFLNAILQALSTCPSLLNWLNSVQLRAAYGQNTTLVQALNYVLKVLNNTEDCENEDYCPTEIIEALQARRWVISPDQQDAHELFHVLTETLGEESSKYPASVSILDTSKLMDPNCEFQPHDHAVNRIRTLLPVLPRKGYENPFRGLMASQLQCTRCAFKYPVRYDTFDSLTLSLPPTARLGGMRVEDLLSRYVRPETVQEVHCEGCARTNAAIGAAKTNAAIGAASMSVKSTFVKKLTIGKLPQCLCIHIQRTVWRDDGVPMKRSDPVTFSETLCMEPYVYHRRATDGGQRGLGWPPRLRGGSTAVNAGSQAKNTQTRVNKNKYSHALNLLKAMHFNVVYNPRQAGIHIEASTLKPQQKPAKTTVKPEKTTRSMPVEENVIGDKSVENGESLTESLSVTDSFVMIGACGTEEGDRDEGDESKHVDISGKKSCLVGSGNCDTNDEKAPDNGLQLADIVKDNSDDVKVCDDKSTEVVCDRAVNASKGLMNKDCASDNMTTEDRGAKSENSDLQCQVEFSNDNDPKQDNNNKPIDNVTSNNNNNKISLPYESTTTKNLLYHKHTDTAPHSSPTESEANPIHRLAAAFRAKQARPALSYPGQERKDAYRLVSVVEHLGDVFSGHFVTYRRAPGVHISPGSIYGNSSGNPCGERVPGGYFSPQWLYTSDVHVRKVRREEVFRTEAYMLFYERV